MNRTIVLALALVFSISAYSQPAQDKPYSITGVVVDNVGNPMPDVRIHATYLAFRWAGGLSAVSGADGSFLMGVPRADTYVLTFEKPAGGLLSTYIRFYYSGDEFRPEVVVEENKPSPKVTLRFPKLFGTIKTTIRDVDSGKPVARPRIKLCQLQSHYCYTTVASNQPLPAISEGFMIQVVADGYEDWYQTFPSGVPFGTTKDLLVPLTRIATPGQSDKSGRLPPPELVFPENGADLYSVPDVPRMTTLRWSPVVGAASYMVDVDGCEAVRSKEAACKESYPLYFPNWPPSSGIKETSYEFTFLGAQPGRWRVWAVDSDGRPGSKSDWYTFFYHL